MWFFLSLLFLIFAAWVIIQTPAGQNWIGRIITKKLSKELNSKIDFKKIDFSLFNRLHVHELLLEDQAGDTVLYAGNFKMRITDWFFFKEHVVLKYVGLENAIIKLQRSDSVWHHQFLADYFSSGSSSSSGRDKGGISLNLEKIELKQVRFSQYDAWLGKDMTVTLGQLSLDAEEIDFSKKIINGNSLQISEPEVALYNYKRLKPRRVNVQQEETNDSLVSWNLGTWAVNFEKIMIRNGLFKTSQESVQPVLATFDGKNIEFKAIDAEINNLRLISDTISGNIKLKTKERSGFEVKQLLADTKVTPQSMMFDNLEIRTNNSVIRDFFMMSYHDIDDMGYFIDKVKMAANFSETELDSDDIAFFASGLKHWKKKISLQGKARGTVNDMFGKEMIIKAGNSTLLNGDISLIGLPNIEQTFINFTANEFRTTYSDAITIIPALRKIKSPDLEKITNLNFKGSFTGFIRNFVTDGTLRTNLGTVITDVNFKFPTGGQPEYSGNISTNDFRIGEFLNDPLLGNISLKGRVAGTGFTKSSINTIFNGAIHFIDYNKYRYSNININGHLVKQYFDGKASINDPNANLTLDGLFDLSPESSDFDVGLIVKNINLQKINFTKQDFSFSGDFKLNFKGRNIDEFTGRASIRNASFLNGEQRLPIDSLILDSRIIDDKKNLTIFSNEFDAAITGNFRINDLPDAFMIFLNKYYPAYIKKPESTPANQSFTFEVNTRNVEPFLSLIHKDLGGFNYSRVAGRLNLFENQLELEAEIPYFTYKEYVFSNTEIKGKGTLEKLLLTGTAGTIVINDSINLPESGFLIEAANDVSKININTSANQPINKANLNAIVKTYQDGVVVEIDSSSFSMNGKPWIIDKDGRLDFRKASIADGSLVLRSGEQEIKLQTDASKKGEWNDLFVTMKKVNLSDFGPLILPNNRLEGLVTGSVQVEDPFRKLNIISDIKAEQLRLDNDSIGTITAQMSYDNSTGMLTGKGKNLNPENQLDFSLSLSLKDKEKLKNNRISINTTNYPLNIIERFLGELFSDVQGFVTGPIEITGPLNEINITTKAKLRNGGLKVKFTQCFYKIQDTEIELTPERINLNGIVLTDPVTGNPVYLRGDIRHQSFRNMFFDLVASTRKPFTSDPLQNKPILLINTTIKDNPQFYGKAFGTGLFSLTGPESELFMNIAAIASNKDSSYVTIPSSTSKESGNADFLVERKYGREMSELGVITGSSNIIYDVDLVITPAVNLKVVLDEVTNDQIKGRGEGTLSIHSGTNEPLQMRGRFNILDGNYLFTFQSLFKRPFELRKGSDNYIEWVDDPMEAKIHFDAVYTADKVSFSPLVAALNLDPSLNRYREDVYVVANLSGNLFSPDFKFKLEFPPNSKAKNDPSLNFSIQQLEKNPNQINRQVTYLIVFNSFAPLEGSNTTNISFGSAINELAYSTISSLSGLLFNQVNRELNKALSKILKTDNVSINFTGSVYNRNLLEQQGKNSFNINQGNVNINVPISFFKDRFIITLGSTLDVPLESTIEQNIQFLPDVSAEWLINQSGTVRATFFYRQDLDILTTNSSGAGKTRRSGASVSYRKEFDNIDELFRRNKRKKQEPETPDSIINNN